MSNRSLALLMSAVVTSLGCNGPLGLLPGGALADASQPHPADWSGVPTSATAQLETNPAEPYSVNLVYTVMGGEIYINAGDTETQWVQNMNADSKVRLRIEGTVYDFAAERVNDPQVIAEFGKAWTSQSTFRRDPATLDEVWLYKLAKR